MDAQLAQTPEDFLKDCIREAVAKRDAIQDRGFDTARRRAELQAEIDDYLEDLLKLMDDQ